MTLQLDENKIDAIKRETQAVQAIIHKEMVKKRAIVTRVCESCGGEYRAYSDSRKRLCCACAYAGYLIGDYAADLAHFAGDFTLTREQHIEAAHRAMKD